MTCKNMRTYKKACSVKPALIAVLVLLFSFSLAAYGLSDTPDNPLNSPDDHTPPLVAIISPLNGLTISGLVWIEIAASDKSGIDSVMLHIDTGSSSEDHTCTPYGIFWNHLINTNNYPNGIQLSIQAIAKDLSPNANLGFSSVVTLRVSGKPIHFNLHINKESPLSIGDSFNILLDVWNGIKPQFVDLYFIMIHPSGRSFIAWKWDLSISPAFSAISIPACLNISSLSIYEGKLPSKQPPVLDFGIYTFAIAATNSGTSDIISNIATTSFDVW